MPGRGFYMRPKALRKFGPGKPYRMYGNLRSTKRIANRAARWLRSEGWAARVVPFKFHGRGETEYAVYRRPAVFTKKGMRRRRRR